MGYKGEGSLGIFLATLLFYFPLSALYPLLQLAFDRIDLTHHGWYVTATFLWRMLIIPVLAKICPDSDVSLEAYLGAETEETRREYAESILRVVTESDETKAQETIKVLGEVLKAAELCFGRLCAILDTATLSILEEGT